VSASGWTNTDQSHHTRLTAIARITTATTVAATTAATEAADLIVSPPRSMLTPGDVPASALG
jgi:hypothetical protein